MSHRRHAWAEVGFVLLLLPILGGVLAGALRGPMPLDRPVWLLLIGGAGLSWLAAVALAPRVAGGRPLAWALIVGAVALRLAVQAGDPELSDDVHRYVWEGGLVAEGQSPYAFAPDAPELADERERWAGVYGRMNNRAIAAAYPPLTQAFHALVVAGAGGPAAADGVRAVRGLRLASAGLDLLVLVPLFGLLRLRKRPPALAVVWAWCPLVALEFGGSAHFDSLGILLLVSALYVAERARTRVGRRVGFALLAAGTLVKFLPVCALPFLLRDARARDKAEGSRGLALFLLLVVLGFVPFLWLAGGAVGLGGGLSEYALRWESFNLVFRWIEAPLAAGFSMDGGLLDPRRIARGLVLLVWLGLAARLWKTRCAATRAAFVLIGAFLVLTPTLHPWYLTWMLPFLALFPSRAWAFLCAVAPLFYWPLAEWRTAGEWIEPVWLWPAVALPFFLLLALEAPSRPRLHSVPLSKA